MIVVFFTTNSPLQIIINASTFLYWKFYWNIKTLKLWKLWNAHTAILEKSTLGYRDQTLTYITENAKGNTIILRSPPHLTLTLQARHPKTSYNIHIYYKHAILYWWPTKYWCINLVSVTSYRIRGQRKQTDINQSQT